ncbi:MAG: cysteine--tRNA ligase [Candidatus Latescibacteria bacterium]|jgi:cysteinyl-tRNA synthetase|nr:cysteine--tRNA ligase [Candidatus Latescibacterota bacterium]MBT4137027.1 cysteine--tRNA ligase [Candidatus Latescibacterota bacterium]
MDIRFYNTLTNRDESFEPLEPNKVTMYSCGPTVYDFVHVGNFKSFLFSDLLRRFLECSGYDVHHVMNITDVGHMTDDDVADATGEDKMAVAARKLKEAKKSGQLPDDVIADPEDPYQVAQYFTQAFIDDASALGMKVAQDYPNNMPHATQHVDGMIALIETLIAKDHAYVADDGVVYFSVESFSDYGKLSGNTLDHLIEGSGGRIASEHQAVKRHPADFFLWKPDEAHIMKWDSPWGAGYPGWHIECSAMAMKVLDQERIDIHTGGEDNIFPHHECEIAQSCCATGHSQFAQYWIHPRFLMVDGEKMSKSKGNFYTARDVLEGRVTGREVHPSVLRFELIKTHYRTQTNFTQKGIQDSANVVRKFTEFGQGISEAADNQAAEVGNDHPVVQDFLSALADDMNISAALAVMHAWMSKPVEDAKEALGVFQKLDSVLGIANLDAAEEDGDEGDVAAMCKQIDEARASKDYATADRLRDELVAGGYEVRSSAEGSVAQKKLA